MINSDAVDTEDKSNALVELADMNLLMNREDRARSLYLQAWELMEEHGLSGDNAEVFFRQPVLLGISNSNEIREGYFRVKRRFDSALSDNDRINSSISMDSDDSLMLGDEQEVNESLIGAPLHLCSNHVLGLTTSRGLNDLADYQMSMEFSVDEDGRVFDVLTRDQNVPGKLRQYVEKMLYVTRFRPRMVDGIAVTTTDLDLIQSFSNRSHDRRFAGPAFDPESHANRQGCRENIVARI
jgi:hypothetical protein